ncbi:DUF1820 family protein [Pokkaliibacter sp. CJK22405]|uniref:DUF1820 family protein n=1 Tax=Pokkaliibacter sp. CJK22405 TaxID=3384615 RepID=UPI00398477AE
MVDLVEEKLKAESAEVKCSDISIHSLMRIDEVLKEGVAKINQAIGRVRRFPFTLLN